MTARILDGRAIATALESELARKSAALEARFGRKPGLFVVLVGDDPASAVYVRNKTRACERSGVACFEEILPASTTEAALLEKIDRANASEKIDGILVQLPLPAHISSQAVIDRISPDKDVDGFHMVALREQHRQGQSDVPGSCDCDVHLRCSYSLVKVPSRSMKPQTKKGGRFRPPDHVRSLSRNSPRTISRTS